MRDTINLTGSSNEAQVFYSLLQYMLENPEIALMCTAGAFITGIFVAIVIKNTRSRMLGALVVVVAIVIAVVLFTGYDLLGFFDTMSW